MRDIDLADAEAQLDALVDAAKAGETVRILRGGQPVAQITAIDATAETPGKPVDIALFKRVSDQMPPQPEDAGAFVRRMRDEDRY